MAAEDTPTFGVEQLNDDFEMFRVNDVANHHQHVPMPSPPVLSITDPIEQTKYRRFVDFYNQFRFTAIISKFHMPSMYKC